MGGSEKLSRKDVERVLRRAAALETSSGRADGEAHDALDERDLLRLGEEAGLPTEAVQRALAEHKRGELAEPPSEALTGALGAAEIVVAREIPGPPAPIQRAVDRFLREQLMTVRRHHGERIEWERARGLWPGLARSLDFAQRYAFAPVSRVETLVLPESSATTSVTFRIDLTDLRRDRFLRVLTRGGIAFSIFGLGGTILFPGFGVNDIAALLAGGASAGGLFALERRRYEQRRAAVALAPERFLDLLALRRRRGLEAASPGSSTRPED